MASLNRVRFLSQPLGPCFRNFSTSLGTCQSVPAPNASCINRNTQDRLQYRPNPFAGRSQARNFTSSLTKEDTRPSLINERQTKLYAPYVIEEVKEPAGGGPIYWKVRDFLFHFKRRLLLRSRERRWNWDILRASFAGVPKQSYDPKINQWVALMDNEEWGGVGGRFWIEFSNTVLMGLLYAFLLYFAWYRIVANNKHNVLARWRNREGDEEEDE